MVTIVGYGDYSRARAMCVCASVPWPRANEIRLARLIFKMAAHTEVAISATGRMKNRRKL